MLQNIPVVEGASVLLAATLVWASAIVQHLANITKHGTQYVISDRSVAPEIEGFFGRTSRTLSNNIESALMYIPPVLVLIMVGQTNFVTHVVAAAYIAARCIFSIAYWFKIPLIRSVAWLAGMICCVIAVSYAALALAGP